MPNSLTSLDLITSLSTFLRRFLIRFELQWRFCQSYIRLSSYMISEILLILSCTVSGEPYIYSASYLFSSSSISCSSCSPPSIRSVLFYEDSTSSSGFMSPSENSGSSKNRLSSISSFLYSFKKYLMSVSIRYAELSLLLKD